MASRDVADLIGWTGRPRLTRVVRWRQSMPNYHVGHLDRVATIQTAMDRVDGLHLLSNAIGGVGIAPVCASAERLATRLTDGGAPATP